MTVHKVVRFLDGAAACPPEDLPGRWSRALATPADPPRPGRPQRVALSVPLDLPDLPPPHFAAIDVQWFADEVQALANDGWLAAVDPALLDGACRVVAEEVVLRGQDYLAGRWASGGERYKMMSFGRRDPRLTPAQFSARWRGESGRLGGEPIPDEVQGLAYAQNHPVLVDGHEWPFDAVNEVWFERLDHLRRRGAWFAARDDAARRSPAAAPGPAVVFMSPTERWSMFVREVPLHPLHPV